MEKKTNLHRCVLYVYILALNQSYHEDQNWCFRTGTMCSCINIGQPASADPRISINRSQPCRRSRGTQPRGQENHSKGKKSSDPSGRSQNPTGDLTRDFTKSPINPPSNQKEGRGILLDQGIFATGMSALEGAISVNTYKSP